MYTLRVTMLRAIAAVAIAGTTFGAHTIGPGVRSANGTMQCVASSSSDVVSDLKDTSWQLVKFQSSDGKTLTPDDKTKYTISFGDGRVTARIDCNRGSGSWKSEGPNQLQFGPLALTRVMCPPGSLHDRIVKDWPAVRSYVIKDGHLFLSLMADGGIYEFEPAGGSQSSLFGRRRRLTEIRGAAVSTDKPYIEFDSGAKRFSGDGGCNRIAGSFELNGTQIRFSQAVSTKRACLDPKLQQVETDFFKALEEVTDFQIQGEVLRLNAGEQSILTFRADSTGTDGSQKEARVTGTITYRQRIALTPEAVIEIKLLDISRADAPSVTIAELTIKPDGRQVPIAFELPYDPQRINARGRYSIRARILENGKLRFTNTGTYLVITGGHGNKVNVIVKPVRNRK